MALRFKSEDIKETAFGGITANFSEIGSPSTHRGRSFRIVNGTDETLYFSLDGVKNNYKLLAGTSITWDVSANRTVDNNSSIPKGQSFYVKHTGAAPTTGGVWVEYNYNG